MENREMSNEMIERVARVLVKVNFNDPDKAVDFGMTGFNFMWQLYIKDAKAAIEAMREPTEEMRKVCRFEFAEVDYPAMIDAALKDG